MFACSSRAGESNSLTVPASRTRMRSASEMVCSRCATVSTVHSRKALLTVACHITPKAMSQEGCFMAHGRAREGASSSRETDSRFLPALACKTETLIQARIHHFEIGIVG